MSLKRSYRLPAAWWPAPLYFCYTCWLLCCFLLHALFEHDFEWSLIYELHSLQITQANSWEVSVPDSWSGWPATRTTLEQASWLVDWQHFPPHDLWYQLALLEKELAPIEKKLQPNFGCSFRQTLSVRSKDIWVAPLQPNDRLSDPVAFIPARWTSWSPSATSWNLLLHSPRM